jgi:hypothetical protein
VSDPLRVTVRAVIAVGTSPERPDLYEVHLATSQGPGWASGNLTLVFQSEVASELLSQLQAKPPPNRMGQ